MKSYDDTTDPHEHLNKFNITMIISGATDPIMCKILYYGIIIFHLIPLQTSWIWRPSSWHTLQLVAINKRL